MVLLSRRSWDDWIAQYEQSHQHPVNRRCHQLGIPLIVGSGLTVPLALLSPGLWGLLPPSAAWWLCGVCFGVGWVLQFVGHAFERKPPEFFKDWRFLLVGVRWWLWKLRS